MRDINASSRRHPDLDARQAAERKLCRLFQSFGIDAMTERSRLIDPFLDRAADYWHPHAGSDLGAIAVEEAEAALEDWFTALLEDRLGEFDSAVMVGRAAFLMCDGPTDWPDQLLQPLDSLPSAFVRALRDGAPNAVPPSEQGEMHHQPYQAWSPASAFYRALPVEGSLLPSFAGLFRRETGS